MTSDSASPGPCDSRLPDCVYSFADCALQAKAMASAFGAEYQAIEVHTFPDQECRVRLKGSAGQTAVLYRSLHHPNSKLIESILAASAIRDAGATEITLIAPYLPYMRQDIAFSSGEAVSQKVIGAMLANFFDRFVTLDPHLHRTRQLSVVFKGKPALALTGAPAIINHIRRHGFSADTVVVGPDEESEALTRLISDSLALEWMVARKHRAGDRQVEISVPHIAKLNQRPVIVVDDVISSGTTVAALAQSLCAAGAATVNVYATHALFDRKAAELMRTSGVNQVLSCDGIPHPSNAMPIASVIIDGFRGWN